jgi:hypothetical protein
VTEREEGRLLAGTYESAGVLNTIRNRFNGHAGSFILVAGYDPAYYRSCGYADGGLKTHEGHQVMMKNVPA